jgi:hypothetical protein
MQSRLIPVLQIGVTWEEVKKISRKQEISSEQVDCKFSPILLFIKNKRRWAAIFKARLKRKFLKKILCLIMNKTEAY